VEIYDPNTISSKAEEIRKSKIEIGVGPISKPTAPLNIFVSENEEDPIHRK
jgi:hypothetical protein